MTELDLNSSGWREESEVKEKEKEQEEATETITTKREKTLERCSVKEKKQTSLLLPLWCNVR